MIQNIKVVAQAHLLVIIVFVSNNIWRNVDKANYQIYKLYICYTQVFGFRQNSKITSKSQSWSLENNG